MSGGLDLFCEDKVLLEVKIVSVQQVAKRGGYRVLGARRTKAWPCALKD